MTTDLHKYVGELRNTIYELNLKIEKMEALVAASAAPSSDEYLKATMDRAVNEHAKMEVKLSASLTENARLQAVVDNLSGKLSKAARQLKRAKA